VAKSQPDGYTLLATDETTFINRYLYGKLSYDPAKDFVAITGLGLTHLALAVHPSFPARDIADLIAAAKAAAGHLNYPTYGVGSSSHLSMAMLARMAGGGSPPSTTRYTSVDRRDCGSCPDGVSHSDVDRTAR
jgi:tripartite-type tricarboxylate transporter receptor subunit TctC